MKNLKIFEKKKAFNRRIGQIPINISLQNLVKVENGRHSGIVTFATSTCRATQVPLRLNPIKNSEIRPHTTAVTHGVSRNGNV